MKLKRTLLSIRSLFGALEDAGGFRTTYDYWTLIWICSLLFDTPIFWILALILDFEGSKNVHVLYVLIWGFEGRWMFPTGVWHIDLDLDMVTGLWYTHVSSFGSLSWFWKLKEHPCSSSPHLGVLWTLGVPDWDLASWSWFGKVEITFLYLSWSFYFIQNS